MILRQKKTTYYHFRTLARSWKIKIKNYFFNIAQIKWMRKLKKQKKESQQNVVFRKIE
jgi:hypothetical protein